MKLKNFLTEEKSDLKDKIMEFFKKNPNPPDSKVHAFAEEQGIDPDDMETAIYAILSSLLKEKE